MGETLSADTTGITDADGLSQAVFAYRWLADDAEIDDATGSTYTLTSGDAGKTMKVRVTFTDDAGNEESLTSAATEAVAAGLDLQSATLDGARLTLTYNEILDSFATLPATAFTVSLYILHTIHQVASNSMEGGWWYGFQAPLSKAHPRLAGTVLLRRSC